MHLVYKTLMYMSHISMYKICNGHNIILPSPTAPHCRIVMCLHKTLETESQLKSIHRKLQHSCTNKAEFSEFNT